MTTDATASPGCPLPWARVLRANVRFRRFERRALSEWLRSRGWRPVPTGWIDPHSEWDHGLEGAARIQAIRDAQIILEGLGWVMTGGGLRDGHWTYVSELRKAHGNTDRTKPSAAHLNGKQYRWEPGSRYVTLTTALRHERIPDHVDPVLHVQTAQAIAKAHSGKVQVQA